jgi:hypothetical protein
MVGALNDTPFVDILNKIAINSFFFGIVSLEIIK